MLNTYKEQHPYKVFIIGFRSRRLLLFDDRYEGVGRVPFKHRLDYRKMVHNFYTIEDTNGFFINMKHVFIMWGIIESLSDHKYRIVE